MSDYVELGFPNHEVSTSLAQLYSDELLGNANRLTIGLPSLQSALAEKSLNEIVTIFNNVFNSIDYQNFPVQNEAACRAILQVLLIGTDMFPKVEVHTADGRSDLEVEAGNRHWVFEIKFAQTEAEENKRLAEGIAQMKARHYGEAPRDTKTCLMRAVLVFSGEKRRFTQWIEL